MEQYTYRTIMWCPLGGWYAREAVDAESVIGFNHPVRRDIEEAAADLDPDDTHGVMLEVANQLVSATDKFDPDLTGEVAYADQCANRYRRAERTLVEFGFQPGARVHLDEEGYGSIRVMEL